MNGLGCMLIADSSGIPFYSRVYNGFQLLDDALLSGLISAIGTVGKKLFNQEIATIAFGTGSDCAHVMVITRELFSEEKTINFVYFYQGHPEEILMKLLREISTTLFMETKNMFRIAVPDTVLIRKKIDQILDKKFSILDEKKGE